MITHTIDLQFMGHAKAIASYLIELPGALLLVDPGPDTCFDRLAEGIAACGYRWQEVKHVLLTHIHFDHAGAAWRWARAGATVHVHPLGYKHMLDPERLWNSAAMIYGSEGMQSLWGAMEPIAETQLVQHVHDASFSESGTTITAYHTPGHAKHHIAWRVGDELFVGDVGGVKIDDGPVEPPCPPPDIDVPAWRESITLMRSLPGLTKVYRAHFAGVDAEAFVGECDALEMALDRWVEKLTKLRADKPATLKEDFIDYIENQRPAAVAEAYTLANPAFMSVGGLLRYLDKRQQSLT